MKSGRKAIALLLAVLIVGRSIPGPYPVYASDDLEPESVVAEENESEASEENGVDIQAQYQDQIDEYNDKLGGLEEERKRIEQSLNATRSDKEREAAAKNAIRSVFMLAIKFWS